MKKFFFLLLSFLSISQFALSQKDSGQVNRRNLFSIYLQAGTQQMNFSELRQYEYLMDQPPNISIKEEVGLLIGNRKKAFISAYMGISDIFVFSLNKQKNGSYNNYKVRSSGSYGYWGSSIYYKLPIKKELKIIYAIYPNIGIQFVRTDIISEATGAGFVNADTAFFLEYGHAKSTLVNLGVKTELQKLLKKSPNSYNSIPLTFALGYTFQIQNPKWSYTTPPSNTIDPRKINQGGFYFMIGYSIWFPLSYPQSTKK